MSGHLTLPRNEPDRSRRASTTDRPYLVPLFTGKRRVAYMMLALAWAIALIAFWRWWLAPDHKADPVRFYINCAILFWITVVPGYFIVIVARAQVPNRARGVRTGLRVAMVVTKAPSEPVDVVKRTLLAMLGQTYPHDTWLADEDPEPETLEWCRANGVQVSTRKGIAAYHQASWPRRTKCKEGNLAYFYDHYAYERYDFVSQLDADQVPTRTYLAEMLLPFSDKRVGYVSAPSICDSNAAESWSARGRLYVEGPFHGTLQAGYNTGLAPTCIGSHYAVRTRALKEIGGIGPELAEDHSTTLIMNSKGWRGVHALNAIAHGDGPQTFSDMATQEYQWSKSLVMILIRYTKDYFGSLPLSLKGQFLFCQLWYPLSSLSLAGAIVLPAVALWTHHVWANVDYLAYVLYATVLTLTSMAVMVCVKSTGSFRPHDARLLSWEGLGFLFARWPWVMFGTLSAVFECVRGREFEFKVTEKGKGKRQLPLRVVLPYLAIVLFSAVPLVVVDEPEQAGGFYLIAILTGLLYWCLAAAIVIAHDREQGLKVSAVRSLFFTPGQGVRSGLIAVTGALLMLGAGMRAEQGANAIFKSSDGFMPAATGLLSSRPALGVYDPDAQFNASDNIAIDHAFITWTDPTAPAQIRAAYANAKARNRWLMLTIEPWFASGRQSDLVLKDILQGAYDAQIDTMCRSVAALDAPVYVRWGHEMETKTGRYSWANNDAAGYVASYRRFADQCRKQTDKLYWVWSPAGDQKLDEFFPGDDYVDFVGLSVYDCPWCGTEPAGGKFSAASIFREKYKRVQHFGLPVMIAELGVDGDAERKRKSLHELFSSLSRYPLLRAVFYFNAVDTPGVWPNSYRPDWRLHELAGEFRLP